MNVRFIITLFSLFLIAGASSPFFAKAQSSLAKDRFNIYGQLRPSITHIDSRNNTDKATSLTQYQVRARLNVNYVINPAIKVQSRFVMKLSTEMDSMDLWAHPYAPTSSGLAPGQTTIDIFNLAWTASEKFYMEFGRMQHAFQLRGLIPKSFDRYHSQNLASTWSDGLWVRWSASKNWHIHSIFQYNHPKGSGAAFTRPLSFKNKQARISYFITIEHAYTQGFWSQRELSATLIPKAINVEGKDKNYFLFSGRLGVNLPLDISWMLVNLASELAYAPNSPEHVQFNLETNTQRNTGALGWQISANFQRILNKNAFSVLYGYADPGMLISPSYRNNSDTWEVRYQHRFTSTISTEIRYRIRHQQFRPENAVVLRLDKDFYARLTIRL